MDARLIASLVRRESNFNPFAIGMDHKAVLVAQPRSVEQAVATAQRLTQEGKTFSVGLAQIHTSNIKAFGATWRQSFDPCTNLRYGQSVYQGFLAKALKAGLRGSSAVFAALRGYNSGNLFASVSDAYAGAIMAGAGQQQNKAGPVRLVMAGKQEADEGQAQEMAESLEIH